MSEEKLKQQIMAAFNKESNAHLEKFPSGPTSAGHPDLLGAVNGKYLAIEVKIFDKRKRDTTPIRPFVGLTPLQLENVASKNHKGSTALILSGMIGYTGKLEKIFVVRPSLTKVHNAIFTFSKGQIISENRFVYGHNFVYFYAYNSVEHFKDSMMTLFNLDITDALYERHTK